jgi:amidophosphoribosyltransferase
MGTPFGLDDDAFHEECGVFAVCGNPEAAALAALGLHALQHRGQEAAGIITVDNGSFFAHHGIGEVGDIFASSQVMARLKGDMAIGHNRYSTAGGGGMRNIQPLYADFEFGGFALAHNGNLTNAMTLRRQLVQRGALFHTTADTETVVHLMAMSRANDPVGRMIEALRQIEGAYSIVAMTQNKIIGVRDPLGVRPLVLGKLENGSHVLASETVALDIIGADFVRDIKPGEMVVLTSQGVTSLMPFQPGPSRMCVFEYIYFARPDSNIDGRNVYEARKRIGAQLAREAHVDADVIVPVPDSGVPAAIGYAAESGVPFELGIIRNHYVGRTFIEPTDQIRHLGVKLKHNANRARLEGKRVVLVDDSIVRGTTSRKIVDMVRQAGAKEVHMRISSPPTRHPCFYGIDTPSREKLIAAQMEVDEIARFIGADSLSFISVDGLYEAMEAAPRVAASPSFCDACFTGEYPIALTDVSTDVHNTSASALRSEAGK